MPRWTKPEPQTSDQMLRMVRALASKGIGKLTSSREATNDGGPR